MFSGASFCALVLSVVACSFFLLCFSPETGGAWLSLCLSDAFGISPPVKLLFLLLSSSVEQTCISIYNEWKWGDPRFKKKYPPKLYDLVVLECIPLKIDINLERLN